MSTQLIEDLDRYAEALEAPRCLIEYLFEDWLESEDESDDTFGCYIATRLGDAVFVATLYRTGDVELSDEQGAAVTAEVLSLLEIDPADYYED